MENDKKKLRKTMLSMITEKLQALEDPSNVENALNLIETFLTDGQELGKERKKAIELILKTINAGKRTFSIDDMVSIISALIDTAEKEEKEEGTNIENPYKDWTPEPYPWTNPWWNEPFIYRPKKGEFPPTTIYATENYFDGEAATSTMEYNKTIKNGKRNKQH